MVFLLFFRGFRSAAFGRLCVETWSFFCSFGASAQPPSGGCVLKLAQPSTPTTGVIQPPSGGCVLKLGVFVLPMTASGQPPSGGCVLKREEKERIRYVQVQPPSGGCVLKHHWFASSSILLTPAAFGRLCVET